MSDLREAARRVALVAIQHIRRLDELGDAVLLSAQVELERAVEEDRAAAVCTHCGYRARTPKESTDAE